MNTRDLNIPVITLLGVLCAGCGAADDRPLTKPAGAMNEAHIVPGHDGQLPERLADFVAILNAGDPSAMLAFYDSEATAAFRNSRSDEGHRALYERLSADLGRLQIIKVVRSSPDEAVVIAAAEKVDLPVRLVFGVADERIDGLRIEVGGPPAGMSPPMLELKPGTLPAEIVSGLDARLLALTADDAFSGVVLLARDGRIVFHNAYGLADRRSGRHNEITTGFDVGSVTKLLTRIAIAQLAQGEKLDLDEAFGTYLPDYPDADIAGRVTIMHLLNHSSGLGDVFNDRWRDADKSLYREPRDFFPLFAGRALAFEPGSGRAYSNAGFIVLGAVIEAVSGQRFADYLAEHIFAPAGMTRSGMLVHDGSNSDLAVGYTRPAPGSALQPNTGMLPVAGCPAGSSTHTAEDLFRLERALRAGRLLDDAWTAWVYTGAHMPQDAGSYALGVAGGAPGVSTGLEASGPLVVIVLSNLDPPSGEALARELYEALADVPDA